MELKRTIKALARIGLNIIYKHNLTHCPYLYDSVFINSNGDVYICCHWYPGVIGNIYKNTLEEIWENSEKLRQYRFWSKNKGLFCFFRCNILTNTQKQKAPNNPKPLPYPRRVWLLMSEFCNINCIMCGLNKNSKVFLDNETLKKNIDWRKVDEIEFQGGEILAMKSAKEMYLWLTQELNKKVNLITNGILISSKWAEYLVAGADWVQISVNAASKETHEKVNVGSNFDKVFENIKKLTELKLQTNSKIKIIYKFSIVPENIHEIADSLDKAEALGCDEIMFGYDYSVIDLLKKDPMLKLNIRNQVTKRINKSSKVIIETFRLKNLNLYN